MKVFIQPIAAAGPYRSYSIERTEGLLARKEAMIAQLHAKSININAHDR
jgi:hypothetical protein